MTDVSTTITGTVDLEKQSLTLTNRVALYEVRTIELSASGGNFPAGTYKAEIVYGGRTIALSALSVSAGKLTGTLNLNTTQLAALFQVLPVHRVRPVMVVWDDGGKVLWARSSVDVWRNEWSDGDSDPVTVHDSIVRGSADIASGERDVVVVFGAGTVLASASIAASVIVPAGAPNLFVVATQFSTSGATFTLNATPDRAGYKLTWMVAQ